MTRSTQYNNIPAFVVKICKIHRFISLIFTCFCILFLLHFYYYNSNVQISLLCIFFCTSYRCKVSTCSSNTQSLSLQYFVDTVSIIPNTYLLFWYKIHFEFLFVFRIEQFFKKIKSEQRAFISHQNQREESTRNIMNFFLFKYK